MWTCKTIKNSLLTGCKASAKWIPAASAWDKGRFGGWFRRRGWEGTVGFCGFCGWVCLWNKDSGRPRSLIQHRRPLRPWNKPCRRVRLWLEPGRCRRNVFGRCRRNIFSRCWWNIFGRCRWNVSGCCWRNVSCCKLSGIYMMSGARKFLFLQIKRNDELKWNIK